MMAQTLEAVHQKVVDFPEEGGMLCWVVGVKYQGMWLVVEQKHSWLREEDRTNVEVVDLAEDLGKGRLGVGELCLEEDGPDE